MKKWKHGVAGNIEENYEQFDGKNDVEVKPKGESESKWRNHVTVNQTFGRIEEKIS